MKIKDSNYSNYLFEQEKKQKKHSHKAMRSLKGNKHSRWVVAD